MDKVKRLIEEKGSEVHSVPPGETVWEAVRTMAGRHIGAILVVEGTQLVGIFSERDLLVRVLLTGLDPTATPIKAVMSTDVVYVTPDTPVRETMAIMTERRCRHLPVMDGEVLKGVVSIGDCTRWVSRDQEYTIRHLQDFIHGKYPG